MKKIIIISMVAQILMCSCSLETKVVKSIVHKETKKFIENQNFNNKKLLEYKVNDVIVVPFFRTGDEKDTFMLLLSAYSNDPEAKKITVVDYELKTEENGKGNTISDDLSKTIKFEPHWDEYWGKNVLFAGADLFLNEKLAVNENTNIELIIKVEVGSAKKKETKVLRYKFEYSEDEYLIDMSQ